MPSRASASGFWKGNSTASLRDSLTSSRPPMSLQVTYQAWGQRETACSTNPGSERAGPRQQEDAGDSLTRHNAAASANNTSSLHTQNAYQHPKLLSQHRTHLGNLKCQLPHGAGPRARLGCLEVSDVDARVGGAARHQAAQCYHGRLVAQRRQVGSHKAVGGVGQLANLQVCKSSWWFSETSTKWQRHTRIGQQGALACSAVRS